MSALSTASGEMTVQAHLSELRSRLIRCCICFVTNFLLASLSAPSVVLLIKRPLGSISLQCLSLEEPFMVLVKIAALMALVLSAPYLIYQAAMFALPALKTDERRLVFVFAFLAPLLFICGALFAYFCLLPSMLKMLSQFGSQFVVIQPRLDSYVSLVINMMAMLGMSFQLPVIILMLGHFRLISYRFLIKHWRIAVFASAVAAAVITPDPTAISMIFVMLVLCSLYFASAVLLWFWQELVPNPQCPMQIQ